MNQGDSCPPRISRTLKLTIAYDGAAYAGWQYQCDKPTVQDTLEKAIEKVTGRQVRVLASGRTDAGVHALGQVVGFRTDSHLPPDILLRALNANLPHDIAVLDVAEAPEGFHAIAHVVRKRYRYVIHDGPVRDVFQRQYAWHYRHGRLDVEAMQRAALPLLGTHDFCSFESSGAERKTSIRTVFELTVSRGLEKLPSPFGSGAGGEGGNERDAECIERGRAGQGGKEGLGVGCVKRTKEVEQNSELHGAFHAPYELPSPLSSLPSDCIFLEIEANGFLYNMVRAIVGTLVEVGRGERPENWPGEVLHAMDRRRAGPTAPPQGLFLVRVEYE
jgi:tRNA pseudouridine38-40 synthase